MPRMGGGGELLRLSQHVDALLARRGLPALSQRNARYGGVDALFRELALFPSALDRTGSGKLSLAVASTSPLFPAVVPT